MDTSGRLSKTSAARNRIWKRRAAILSGITLAVSLLVVVTHLQVEQQRMDYEMFQALRTQDSIGLPRSLIAGANPNAVEPDSAPSLGALIRRLLHIILNRARKSALIYAIVNYQPRMAETLLGFDA